MYYRIEINGQVVNYVTARAYRECTLQMSTGDFHVHVAVPVNSLPPDVDESTDLLDMYVVRDWAGNLIHESELGTFQDTWGWIYDNIADELAWDEYSVVSKAEYGKLRLVK